MSSTPTVFFHGDLDGVVCYLLMCWAANCRLNYVVTTPMKLRDDFRIWKDKKTEERVYFVDLDVTSIASEIDEDRYTIFDHHKTNVYNFKVAKSKITNESSCAKLIYNLIFKDKNLLSKEQQLLVALANDWDSGKKENPLSEELNIVFHNTTDKYNSFIEDYYRGFKPFDKFKKNIVLLYKRHCEEYLNKLTPFFGDVVIEGNLTKVGAVFCEKYVTECCDELFKKHNVDVAIAVLMSKKRIAVRRHPENKNTDISLFVQKIAFGGGHEAAAGGTLTEEFIEFTKLLRPVE